MRLDKDIDNIHAFWFGDLDASGMSPGDRQKLWFKPSPETDEECRQRFGALVEEALQGGLTGWQGSDRGIVALVLLLDQLTRNIYRGSARVFAGDSRALALSRHYIAGMHHLSLPPVHQVFLFMPLEHSEDIAAQNQCVALFESLSASTGLQAIEGFARYAVAHRDVIARFGRFPHRNELLGRDSSPDEIDHLKTHGGF